MSAPHHLHTDGRSPRAPAVRRPPREQAGCGSRVPQPGLSVSAQRTRWLPRNSDSAEVEPEDAFAVPFTADVVIA